MIFKVSYSLLIISLAQKQPNNFNKSLIYADSNLNFKEPRQAVQLSFKGWDGG